MDEHCERLEVHFLANPDAAIRFALVSDWPEAAVESREKDEQILAHARGLLASVNARHPPVEGEQRFYLFHRRRLWNPAEACWMGLERKRGKLVELNHLLLMDRDTTFLGASRTDLDLRDFWLSATGRP